MITHVPGPFERMVRRLSARIEAWLDGLWPDLEAAKRDLKTVPRAVAPRTEIERPAQGGPPRPNATKPDVSVRAGPSPVRPAQAADDSVVRAIARAIVEGRAKGSQREIARAFNVGRTTVQRAQKLVHEPA